MTNNNDSRKAFEDALEVHYAGCELSYRFKRDADGDYEYHDTYTGWSMWQASRADLLAMLDKPEVVEVMAKEYANSTGYYVEFHKGLKSASSDKIRHGIKAAIEALKKELRG